MSEESQELLADLRAVYAELFPYRDPQRCHPTDAELAGLVMLRREMRMGPTITVLPAGYAAGAEPGPTVRTKRKGKPSD